MKFRPVRPRRLARPGGWPRTHAWPLAPAAKFCKVALHNNFTRTYYWGVYPLYTLRPVPSHTPNYPSGFRGLLLVHIMTDFLATTVAEEDTPWDDANHELESTNWRGTAAQPALPDPPPTVTAALMSTVREPTPDQVASWTTVNHKSKWSKLKGEISWPPSMAGSLLWLLAGPDEDPADLDIAELASVSDDLFELRLRAWQYSREPPSGLDWTGETVDEIELNIKPSPIDL